jgi:integrase/recombinase XerD
MHNIVYRLLKCKLRKSRWVFTKADGGKVNIHSLESRFKHRMAKLGVQDASPHMFRHTFAANFLRKTGNMRALQLILGHKSIKTTQIYAHLSDQHLSDLINHLPGPIFGTPVILPGRGIA